MAVTLAFQSALDVTRVLRADGHNMNEMSLIPLTAPSAWVGDRLSMRNFDSSVWAWQKPSSRRPLHVLVPDRSARIRGTGIMAHAACSDLPAGSILWLDDHTSLVCPDLLFLQMARFLPFPALVMLGYELCGHFTRFAEEPLLGPVTDGIPAATSVASLEEYLASFDYVKGLTNARKAVQYINDHAISAPEALLATMYVLPTTESGYGLGSVTLNERVQVDDSGTWVRIKSRYPDLSFSFGPLGINYDGNKHFDVSALMMTAELFARAAAESQDDARKALMQKLVEARAKIIDDNLRNRQLAAQGRIVFSATKEDLSDGEHLDVLTRQILRCAHEVFGVNTAKLERTLDDTSLTRDRWELLDSLSPHGHLGKPPYGKV